MDDLLVITQPALPGDEHPCNRTLVDDGDLVIAVSDDGSSIRWNGTTADLRTGRSTLTALGGIELSRDVDGRVRLTRKRVSRPVYWSQVGRDFVASTSLPAVLDATTRRGLKHVLDVEGLALYFTFQYLPGTHTMYRDVSELDVGQTLIIGAGEPPKAQPCAPLEPLPDDGDLVELLSASLTEQLDPDGRAAFLLSGGMDTSTNLALARAVGVDPALALTATFAEAAYDEWSYAQLVAEHVDVEHRPVLITRAMVDELPAIVRAFAHPNGDRAILAQHFVTQAAREAGCAQLVSGEGGDELLGPPRTRTGDERLAGLPEDPDLLARHYLELTGLGTGAQRTMLCEAVGADVRLGEGLLADRYRAHPQADPYEQVLYGQWATWLPHGVLEKDRHLCRAAGLDLVAPLASEALMSRIAAMPVAAKRAAQRDKAMAKAAMASRLPTAIIERQKHKFWLPFAEWFRADAELLRGPLDRPEGFVAGIVGRPTVARWIDEHLRGEDDHNRLLWALLFLEHWHEEVASRWL